MPSTVNVRVPFLGTGLLGAAVGYLAGGSVESAAWGFLIGAVGPLALFGAGLAVVLIVAAAADTIDNRRMRKRAAKRRAERLESARRFKIGSTE